MTVLANPRSLRLRIAHLIATTVIGGCSAGDAPPEQGAPDDTFGADTIDTVDTDTFDTDTFDTDSVDTDTVDTDTVDTDTVDTDTVDTDTVDTDLDTDTVDTDSVDTDLDTAHTDSVDTDPDTDETVETVETDTEAPDLHLGWTRPECIGGRSNLLGSVEPPPAYAHLALMDARAARNTRYYPYADTPGETGVPDAPAVTLEERGAACWDAPNPTACAAAWADTVLAADRIFIGTTDGGAPQTWNVRDFLGTIDNPEEALLYMASAETWCANYATETAGGFWVDVFAMLDDCPVTYGWNRVLVGPDGTTTQLGPIPDPDNSPGFCIGRRPPGLCAGRAARGSLGARLARHAALEAASVTAFEHLHAELVALGAPNALLARVLRAARDEVRHAKHVGALALRYGAAPERLEVSPAPHRCAEAIAIDNMVEGCVGETWGALVGMWQAQHAADPMVAATMHRIARDEIRHAALSWEIDGWLNTRLDADAQSRVTAARAAALSSLQSATWTADPVLGTPAPAQATALLRSFERMVAAA